MPSHYGDKKLTRKDAKQQTTGGGVGSKSEYIKYKRDRISRGQPYVGFGQWRKQRGG
jgi:hypothetical protein